MKLATLRTGDPDGELVVVSRDLSRMVRVPAFGSLRLALENWDRAEPLLGGLAEQLERGVADGIEAFDPLACAAPLPRAWQWLDGSCYHNHGVWMSRSLGRQPPARTGGPLLMYQGGSDALLGAYEAVDFVDESHGIDFEGEIAVVTGEVPMGATRAQCAAAVRLVMLANDWSLRHVQAGEIATGFGFLQCKPATSFAPVALTPDELGDAWRESRLHLRLHACVNGREVGSPDAGQMEPGFDGLIAHAAATRRLSAGTIVGGGTVSEEREGAGSATIAEMRAMETVLTGEPRTPFLRHGDRVRLEVFDAAGRTVFGALDQSVAIRRLA